MANSILKKLGSYLRPYSRKLFWGISALFIVNGVDVYIRWLIGDSVDQLQNNFNFEQLIIFVVIILILASIMWGIRMLSRLFIFGIGRQVEFDLKQKIFEHLLKLEPAYFSVNSSGDLINKATSDVDNIRRLVGFSILSLANTIFAYSLTLPTMLIINIKLSLMAICVYPLMFITVQLFSSKLRDQQGKVQERLSSLSDLIQEDISGISLIKIYAQEENESQAFSVKNNHLLKANLKLARTRNFLIPIVQGIANLSIFILFVLGTLDIENNLISVGEFITLILYAERLVFPTALLGFVITSYQRGEVSINRVEDILQVQPTIKDESDLISFPSTTILEGEIKSINLTYTYPGAKNPALNKVNFKINQGETVAIVGSIGAGKSTLANAIPRLLDIQFNQLFIDGIDIKKIKLADLRKAIAYVPQESFLFSTTIKNNIRYGDPLKEEIEVEYAAKQAQIHAEILNFPQQYETLVGERGITLSGGQRQRSSLARALLVDAPILILDDALSSVDNKTATQILENLKNEQNKTVIFITHQLSAAKNADRILVMDHGKIIQNGTHNQLLQQKGLYQYLWEQNQLEEIGISY
jgi:ATP-binding cassette subfamily B protein